MKNIPGGHNLFVSDKETASVIENLYSVSLPTLGRESRLKLFRLNPIRLPIKLILAVFPTPQKFKLMMARKDENSKKALLNQLGNINKHLEKRGTRFLTGDTLCCFDTELMPRLQHLRLVSKSSHAFLGLLTVLETTPFLIERLLSLSVPSIISRIGGGYFCDFQIPHEYKGIWRYLNNTYNLDAFLQSCPADQVAC